MESYSLYKILLFFLVSSLLCACSSTRYVGKDEYLLNRVKVSVDNKEVSASDLKKAVRQHPNTRILGIFRFHLGLYNLSGKNENKRINKWLRSIGEAPVIYSPFLTDRSKAQMGLYLENKGYHKSTIRDSVWFKKKKAYTNYYVTTGPLTRIDDFSFKDRGDYIKNPVPDSIPFMRIVLADSVNTTLKKGMPLDKELLDAERDRLTKMLREQGYFNFSKNLIDYYADTTVNTFPDFVPLFMNISHTKADSTAFQKYRINDISINLDYDPLTMMAGADSAYKEADYFGFRVMFKDRMKIRPKIILETLQFESGELYNVNKVISSYSRLQALNLFKFINIVFREGVNRYGELILDCEIQLTPLKRQSYNVSLEGTNNSGNIGVGGNLSYNHRNLFKGGENLTLSVWGALKKERLRENEIFSTTEIGAELKFVTPQFWLPVFRLSEFRRNYAPKTSISLSFSEENTQFYRRRVAGATYGYLWRRADSRWRYTFDLIDFNYVLMPYVVDDFIKELRSEYVRSAYTDHMILSANFSAVFTDQVLNTPMSYNYFRGNVESSGNVLYGIDNLFNSRKRTSDDGSYYKLLGVRYAQFVKGDGEYRFNQYINKANSIVYRFFAGLGYPYGNMKALPFEEAYFSGGANGIRAWHSRTLGPGSYSPEDTYPNSVGDFKIEANLEYRFDLFWLLEGALFLDAGNVWTINKYEDRVGAGLTSEFYKQIALGTGLGLRLDLNFFLLRFDLGLKMYDPIYQEGNRFVLFTRNGGFKKSVFNIAIGYPF